MWPGEEEEEEVTLLCCQQVYVWMGSCLGDSCGASSGGWRLQRDTARFLHTLALFPRHFQEQKWWTLGSQIPGDIPDQERGNLKPLTSRALYREGPVLRFLSGVLLHLATESWSCASVLSFPVSFSRALYHSEQRNKESAPKPSRSV